MDRQLVGQRPLLHPSSAQCHIHVRYPAPDPDGRHGSSTTENDADEALLGGIYHDSGITAAVWAPTASNVELLIYNDNKSLSERIEMVRDNDSGIWKYEGDSTLDRQLYRYEITVFHPNTGNIETLLGLLCAKYSNSRS